MMKTKKTIMAFTAVIAFAFAGLALVSCKKDDIGMNEPNGFYSYSAVALDKDNIDVEGEFDLCIEREVGRDVIRGGADEDVIRACDACYKHIKDEWENVHGSINIVKSRHPDGLTFFEFKQKVIKTYKF